jgi:hypothetical protein
MPLALAAAGERRQVDCGDRIFCRHGAPFAVCRSDVARHRDYIGTDSGRNGIEAEWQGEVDDEAP